MLYFITAGEKQDVTEREAHAGASGGIYPFFDSQSKPEVGTEATNKADIPTVPQPAVTPSTGNQFVTGLGDGSNTEERSGDPGARTDPQQLSGADVEQGIQEINNSGMYYLILLQDVFFFTDKFLL